MEFLPLRLRGFPIKTGKSHTCEIDKGIFRSIIMASHTYEIVGDGVECRLVKAFFEVAQVYLTCVSRVIRLGGRVTSNENLN